MAPSTVVCFLLPLLAVGLCAPLTCPNLEDLKPCTCKRVAFGLQVVCANFNTSTDLMKAFQILRDYRVNTVLLHDLCIPETLPTNLFDGMQIKEIKVEKSKLRFSQPAFSGLDTSLYVLNVAEHSLIKSKDRFSLAKLTKLSELNVQRNHLEKVEDKWLNDKVPNVHTIILDSNDITELESNAFGKLSWLRKISLADNRIRTIQRSMFPSSADHLVRIDLSSNEIRTLPNDFFFRMPSLQEIILSNNELKTLPEATWTPVWEQLTQVFLTNNHMECNDGMKWIKQHQKPKILEGDCVLPKNIRYIKDIYNT